MSLGRMREFIMGIEGAGCEAKPMQQTPHRMWPASRFGSYSIGFN